MKKMKMATYRAYHPGEEQQMKVTWVEPSINMECTQPNNGQLGKWTLNPSQALC